MALQNAQNDLKMDLSMEERKHLDRVKLSILNTELN